MATDAGATSIMDSITQAAQELGASNEAAPAEVSAPAPVEPAAPPEVEAKAEPQEPAASDGRVRDGKGRFTPKPSHSKADAGAATHPPQGPPAASEPPPETRPAPTQPLPESIRPPQGLRAVAREEWSRAPKAIQEEFLRLDAETRNVMQQAAEHRKVAQAYRETIAPFEPLIRARGGEVLPVINESLRFRAQLDYGGGRDRARLIAGLVRGYGVDVRDLDEELVAAQGGPGAPAQRPAELRDPRVDQLLAHMQQVQQTTTQSAQAQFRSEVTSFAEEHEFFDDLWPEMAKSMKADPEMSLDEAYEWAMGHPKHKGLRKIQQQREDKKRQEAQAPSRAANVSIRSQPATPINGPPKGSSIMDSIKQAAASLSGG